MGACVSVSGRQRAADTTGVDRILKFFGSNVVVTEGEEWRRHRRLTGPSFSEVRCMFRR